MEEIARGTLSTRTDVLLFLEEPKNAIFTLEKDNMHRTYMVNKAKDSDVLFVRLLIGQDNNDWNQYTYIGLIVYEPYIKFKPKRKQNWGYDTEKVSLAFYLLNTLVDNILRSTDFATSEPKFYHEGKCSKCGKRLTQPNSIAKGMGAKCRSKF